MLFEKSPTSIICPSILHTGSFEAIGMALANGAHLANPAGAASAAIGTANLAIFVPLALQQSVTVKNVFTHNGGTVAGNVDVGLYSETGTRIFSIGATAQSGTSVPQVVSIPDQLILPGRYYMALAASNASATFMSWLPGTTSAGRLIGLYQSTSAMPLPVTATFAVFAKGVIPMFGLALETTV